MSKTIQEAVAEIEQLKDIMIGDGQVDKILEGVDPSTYVMEEAGDFDSPGYDLSAMAIAYIEDGKPMLCTWEEEMY